MLRVAVVDDHHAVRLGLQAAIRAEPGLAVTGVSADGAGVPAMLRAASPDVVLLDYRLPDTDGLSLCRTIKGQSSAPGVILYSAFADAAMIVPAAVAGADAIVHKGGHTRGLLDTIRLVARGGKAMPAVPPGLLEAVGALLDEQDLPVLALLLEGAEPAVIAEALALVPDELAGRIDGMLQRLHVPVALGTG